jgi:hypothetical protein
LDDEANNIRCQLTHETRVQSVSDDVASNDRLALLTGDDTTFAMWCQEKGKNLPVGRCRLRI